MTQIRIWELKAFSKLTDPCYFQRKKERQNGNVSAMISNSDVETR